MNEDLAGCLRSLRLGGLLAHWDDYLALAQKRRLSPVALLQHVIEEDDLDPLVDGVEGVTAFYINAGAGPVVFI